MLAVKKCQAVEKDISLVLAMLHVVASLRDASSRPPPGTNNLQILIPLSIG